MDKIVMALNLIIDYVDEHEAVDEKKITDYLIDTGFDDYEIRQTLSLLDFESEDIIRGGFRVFTRQEEQLLDTEARFYLQKLLMSGIIDLISVERIVEMALETEQYKIDLEQVKNFTLMSLLERRTSMASGENHTEDSTH